MLLFGELSSLVFLLEKKFFFEGWGLDLKKKKYFFFNVNCFVFYLHFIIEIALCKRLYDVLRLIFYASIEDLLIDWWFVKFCLFRWEFVGSLIKNNFRLPINCEKRLKLLHRILGLRKRLGHKKRENSFQEAFQSEVILYKSCIQNSWLWDGSAIQKHKNWQNSFEKIKRISYLHAESLIILKMGCTNSLFEIFIHQIKWQNNFQVHIK